MERARRQVSNLDHKISYIHKGLRFWHCTSPKLDSPNTITEVYDESDSLKYIIDIDLSRPENRVVEEAHVNSKGRHIEAIVATSRIITACLACVKADGSLYRKVTAWLYLSVKSNLNVRDRNYVQFFEEEGCTQDELSYCFFGLSLFLNKTYIPDLLFANEWAAQLTIVYQKNWSDEPPITLVNIVPVLKEIFGFVHDEDNDSYRKNTDGEDAIEVHFMFNGTKPYYSFVHSDCPLCVFTRVDAHKYTFEGQLLERVYKPGHSEDDMMADICFSTKNNNKNFVYLTTNGHIECNEEAKEHIDYFSIVLYDYVTNAFFVPFTEPDDYLLV